MIERQLRRHPGDSGECMSKSEKWRRVLGAAPAQTVKMGAARRCSDEGLPWCIYVEVVAEAIWIKSLQSCSVIRNKQGPSSWINETMNCSAHHENKNRLRGEPFHSTERDKAARHCIERNFERVSMLTASSDPEFH